MAKLTMKRIELLAMLEDSKDIVDLLQRKGVVDISEFGEETDFYKMSTSATIAQLDKYQTTAKQALDILSYYAPSEGGGMLASFAGRKELTAAEFSQKGEKSDEIFEECLKICALEKSVSDSKASIVRAKTAMDAIEPWLSLDIPMSCSGTENTSVFIGTLPKSYDTNALTQALAVEIPDVDAVEVEVISASAMQCCVAVVCHKSDADAVQGALRNLGFVKPADPTKHPPGERYERLKGEIEEIEKDIESFIADIKSFADKKDDIKFLIDCFAMRKDKYEALGKFGMSGKVFVLRGYVPEPQIEGLSNELSSEFDVAISITEPDYEEEDVPILLDNDDFFVGPIESITEMYSLPSNADVDPNPVMSAIYYLLFGLMLSDAGYGLVMVIAMLWVKKKVPMEKRTIRTCNMWMWCGLATIFWGTLFGSWFGDIYKIVCMQFLGKAEAEVKSLALWFEPVMNPMLLLAFSFLFGIIHLIVGLTVRFHMLVKEGKWLDAVFDVGFIYLILLGIIPIGANFLNYGDVFPQVVKDIGKYMLMAGALGVVLTSGRSSKNIVGKLGGGLYALYNTASGYLGDILSYSRLLALGLSTGVIASVVNTLGTIPKSPVVKGILLVVVFVFGHIVNMAINLIGTYVHTNRLQYVEFFAKFYEGGGTKFSPLSINNNKYYRFKEEKQS